MSIVYALLCGMLVYITILALIGRRLICSRWATALGSLALALSCAMLALSTSGIIKHGTHTALTRVGFIGYALSLALIIGQYWLAAWRARVR
jgi:hypothetical protein